MSRFILQNLLGGLCALLFGLGIAYWRSSATQGAPPPAADAFPARALDASLVEAVQNGKGGERWLRLLAAIEEASAAEMPKLILLAGDEPGALRMLAARWAMLDPRHMFRALYAESLLPPQTPGLLPDLRTLQYVLFEEWLKSDPAAAARALGDVPEFSARNELRGHVGRELLRKAPALALQYIVEWDLNMGWSGFHVPTGWEVKELREAMTAVLAMKRNFFAQMASSSIASVWGEKEPQAAMDFALRQTGHLRRAMAGSVMGSWAKKDLASALAFMKAQREPELRDFLALYLNNQWSEADPVAALAWNQENLHGRARAEAQKRIVENLTYASPQRAGELVRSMGAGSTREASAASLFAHWFRLDGQRDAALAWVASLPEAGLRRAALSSGLGDVTKDRPQEAMKLLESPIGRDLPDSFVGSLVQHQATQGPAFALAWADQLAPKQRRAARTALFNVWVPANFNTAQSYALQLPAGPPREEMISALAKSLAWEKTAQAAAWFQTLPEADRPIAWTSFGNVSETERQKIEQALRVQ